MFTKKEILRDIDAEKTRACYKKPSHSILVSYSLPFAGKWKQISTMPSGLYPCSLIDGRGEAYALITWYDKFAPRLAWRHWITKFYAKDDIAAYEYSVPELIQRRKLDENGKDIAKRWTWLPVTRPQAPAFINDFTAKQNIRSQEREAAASKMLSIIRSRYVRR